MFYPDNIVFMAGGFANGQVVSLGLISPDIYAGSGKRLRPGSELYLEIGPENAGDSGPDRNVLPKSAAAAAITEFLGDSHPYVVTDATRLEWTAICNLFGLQGTPFEPQPIEFSDILMAAGIDPRTDRYALASRFNIDTGGFRRNHPVDDARLLQSLYKAVKGITKTKAPE